jgi:hypothetical protein
VERVEFQNAKMLRGSSKSFACRREVSDNDFFECKLAELLARLDTADSDETLGRIKRFRDNPTEKKKQATKVVQTESTVKEKSFQFHK